MDEQTNLIETLRFCATNGDCRDCPCDFQCEGTMGNGLYTRAADALEQESKRADELGDELTAAMDLVHKRDEKIAQLKADLLAKDKNVPDRKIGDWISVEERLPDRINPLHARDAYLVRLKSGCIKTLFYEYDNSDRCRQGMSPLFSEGWEKTFSPVTHWMPLPEPPAGGELNGD